MALILCHECGRQVSTEASACPQCGAPPRRANNTSPQHPEWAKPNAAIFGKAIPDNIRQELAKFTLVDLDEIIGWFLFIISVASIWRSTSWEPDGMTFLAALVFGEYALRRWCARRTAKVFLEKNILVQSTLTVYLQSARGFLWRSILAGVGTGIAVALIKAAPGNKAFVAVMVPTIWTLFSLFALDTPFWCLRKIRKAIDTATLQKPSSTANNSEKSSIENSNTVSLASTHKILQDLQKELQAENLDRNGKRTSENVQLEQTSASQPEHPKQHTMNHSQTPPPTREQWIRQVREAELAVLAMEKEGRPSSVLWKANLERMRSNPPKQFSPSGKMALLGRLIHYVYPQSLDALIMRDWRAGRPPKLPPFSGQAAIEGHLRDAGLAR